MDPLDQDYNQDSNERMMSALETLSGLAGSFEAGISDGDAKAFLQTASDLKEMLGDRKRMAPVAQIVLSLGKYLASKPSAAHPDALPLLQDQLRGLQTLATDGAPDPAARDRLVREKIEQFKAFKANIAPPAPDPRDLDELKEVVLSLDWEITDQTLTQFNAISNGLRQKWHRQALNLNLLKIMQSMIGYIGRKKAAAHTDSIDVLKSVYLALEKVVHTPGMSVPEKKQLLDREIERFNRFKQLAASPAKAAAEPGQDMPPALSHLGQGTKPAEQAGPELTRLDPGDAVVRPVPREPAADIQPALQGKQGVMDDLLNPKETEVDRMLETIHLMDVDGTNPTHNPAAATGPGGDLQPGMSELTPRDKDTTPIPEIEQTLDAFFNIEVQPEAASNGAPEASPLPAPVEPVPVQPAPDESDPVQPAPDESDPIQPALAQHAPVRPGETPEPPEAANDDDGIVPFDYEEEVDDAYDPPAPAPASDDTDLAVLEKLEAAFGLLPGDLDEAGRMEVLAHLGKLEAQWTDEPVKSTLVRLVGMLFERLGGTGEAQAPGPEVPEELPQDDPGPEPEAPPPPPKGVLSKLKRLFRR